MYVDKEIRVEVSKEDKIYHKNAVHTTRYKALSVFLFWSIMLWGSSQPQSNSFQLMYKSKADVLWGFLLFCSSWTKKLDKKEIINVTGKLPVLVRYNGRFLHNFQHKNVFKLSHKGQHHQILRIWIKLLSRDWKLLQDAQYTISAAELKISKQGSDKINGLNYFVRERCSKSQVSHYFLIPKQLKFLLDVSEIQVCGIVFSERGKKK